MAVVLRLLVRYLMELESLDATLMTRSQAHSYASTIDVRFAYFMLCIIWLCFTNDSIEPSLSRQLESTC